MIRTYANLMRRFADARPGLNLLAVEEAALPVSGLRADVLLQTAREISAADEFFLRFVDEGVDTVDGIADYLGLPHELVLDAATRQVSSGNIDRRDSSRFSLTALGKNVVRDLVVSQPTLNQIGFVFDRLSWSPAPYLDSSLLRRSQASKLGLILLPASSTATITTRDISISELNSIMPGKSATVLRVNRLGSRRYSWMPAKLLVFGDSTSRELELAVYIDDDLSQIHEDALQKVGAAQRLNLSVAPPSPVSTYQPKIADINSIDSREEIFSVEHLDHFLHALTNAKKRLVIASQNARDSVITSTFIKYVRDRARRGVEVTIVLDIEAQTDGPALLKLKELTNRQPEVKLCSASLLGISHLVYDDVVIDTGFDWLSGGKNGREYMWNTGYLTRSESNAKSLALSFRGTASQP